MKGAIGNAFILNMVITFIIVFYMLLINSMAFSRAYKINNYILDSLVNFANDINTPLKSDNFVGNSSFDSSVNEYLSRSGYSISNFSDNCPSDAYGYFIIRNNSVGKYEYCIYSKDYSDSLRYKNVYKVVTYMRYDIPVIGDLIKIPITGETETISIFKNDINVQ